MMLGTLLKELARQAGRGAVDALGSAARNLVRRALAPDEGRTQPLSHRDVAHQQEQIRRATSKRTPPKPGGGA